MAWLKSHLPMMLIVLVLIAIVFRVAAVRKIVAGM